MHEGRPGCFGSVMAHEPVSDVCAKCSAEKECAVAVKESILAIQKAADVKEKRPERRKRRRDVKTVKEKASKRSRLEDWQLNILNDEALPIKPRRLVGTVFRKHMTGETLRQSIYEGKNPFASIKPDILRVTCEFLVRFGGFEKKELAQTFMAHGMSHRTAYSQVSIIVGALKILDVAHYSERSGRVDVIKKENV